MNKRPLKIGAWILLFSTTLKPLAFAATDSLYLYISSAPRTAVHISAEIIGQNPINEGGETQPPDYPSAFFDDALPSGASIKGEWGWSSIAYSGTQSHYTNATAGGQTPHSFSDGGHYFIHADPGYLIQAHENIVQYVYRDSSVQQIILQYYTGQGDGEHRVYWGANILQTGGTPNTSSLLYAGPLPPADQWVRLRIPAGDVNLAGRTIKGILFASAGGTTLWDKSTKSNSSLDPGGLGYTLPPQSTNDDATATELAYTIDRASPVRVDVVDADNNLVKTLTDGPAEDPSCCTVGEHRFTWDQKNQAGTVMPDGDYAFLIKTGTGPVDTEVFSLRSDFDPLTDPYPPLTSSATVDANGNFFVISSSAPSTLVKNNPAGLYIASPVALTDETISRLSIDSYGDLYIESTAAGASTTTVASFQAGRLAFETTSLNAIVNVPWNRAMVKATVPIIGGATAKDFRDFYVDVSPGWPWLDILSGETEKLTGEMGDLPGGYFNDFSELDFAQSTWTVLNHGLSEVENSFEIPPGQQTIYGNLATWETGLEPGEEYPENDVFHPATGELHRGRYTVRLRLYTNTGSTRTVMIPIIVARVINKTTGGLVRSDDNRARLSVPALATQNDWSLFSILQSSSSETVFPALPPDTGVPPIPSSYTLISSIYEMLPPGYAFSQPCRLEIDRPAASSTTFGTALYRYATQTGTWQFVSSEQVTTSSGTVIIDDNFTSISQGRAFYALLARTEPPVPPFVNQPFSPTENPFVTITGTAEPDAQIAVFSLDVSTEITPVFTTANSEGHFTAPLMLLSIGTHTLSAIQATDGNSIGSGLTSLPADPVTVVVTSPTVIAVSSVAFYQPQYALIKTNNFNVNERAYIQLNGSDPNPTLHNQTTAVLRSTVSDSEGIVVPLLETAVNSGIYQGSADLSHETNQAEFQLKAMVTGEIIEVISQADPNKKAALTFENNMPPPAPLLSSLSHPSHIQHTFEVNLNEWGTYDSLAGAAVEVSTSAATGIQSVRLTQNAPVPPASQGNFSVSICTRPFDIRSYPLLSFDVRMIQTVRFNLFFLHQGNWLELLVNDAGGELPKVFPPSFDRLGSLLPNQNAPALSANGAWQHVEINLFNTFRKKFPQASSLEDFQIDQIILGDWNAQELFGMAPGNTPVGSWVEFDNLLLTNPGVASQNIQFSWMPFDPKENHSNDAPIAGYSTLLDVSSATLPNTFVNTVFESASFFGKPSGFHTFHARSKNTNDNWGPANHFRVLVDTVPPVVSDPTPAPNSLSESLIATVKLIDPVGHGLDVDSVKFSVNGSTYDIHSQALAYDAISGILTITLGAIQPTPPVFVNGQWITVTINDAADWAGNHINGIFSWSWQSDFTPNSGGDFVPLTVNGGREASWSANGEKVAFISDRSGQRDIWVMSSTDTAEVLGSAISFTSDAALESAPRWVPFAHPLINGQTSDWLAYASNAGGNNNIWIKNAVTGMAYQLTSTPDDDSHPVWSTDTTLLPQAKLIISRSGSGKANLFQLAVDLQSGSVLNEIQLTIEQVGYNLEPAFASNKIIYRRSLYTDNLYRVNADGSNPEALTSSNTDRWPDVRFDEESVVFASQRSGSFTSLWTMSPDGSNEQLLLDNLNLWPDTEPAWSPDGARVAFSTLRPGAWNIWTLSLLKISSFTASPVVFSPVATGPSYYIGGGTTIIHSSFIQYLLTASNALVNLSVISPNGATVRHLLLDQYQSSGLHTYEWDGKDNTGVFVPDGLYTVRLSALGSGAPEPALKELQIRVDKIPPASTISSIAPFISTQTALTLNANDPWGNAGGASGLQNILYRIDGSSEAFATYSPYTTPFVMEAGTHTVYYFSRDNTGNEELVQSQTFGVDEGTPEVDITLVGPVHAGSQLFISTQTAVHVTSFDSMPTTFSVVSGILTTKVQIDSNNPIQITGNFIAVPTVSTTDGPHIIKADASDRAGNNSVQEILNVIVDTVTPTVAPLFNPPTFSNGVHNFIVVGTSISFATADVDSQGSLLNASGVASIRYKIDSASDTLLSPSSVVQIPLGEHAFQISAIDQVSNEGAITSYNVVVTTALPSVILTVGPPYQAPFVSASTPFVLTLASGAVVDHVEINPDSSGFITISTGNPFGFPAPGPHTLEFRAILPDQSPEYTEFLSVITDTAAPTTNIQLAPPTASSGTAVYVRGTTLITLAAFDLPGTVNQPSGVKETWLSINGSSFVYSAPFSLSSKGFSTEGQYTLRAWSIDFVGNTETSVVLSLLADNQAPTTIVTSTGPFYQPNSQVYVASSTFFSLTASENGLFPSGFDETRVSTSGVYFVYESSFNFNQSGPRSFSYYSLDQVGNTESTNQFNFICDITPPSVQINTLGAAFVKETTTYIRSDTQLVIVAPDDYSGLFLSQRSIDGGVFVESNAPFLLPSGGFHTVAARGVDHVFNEKIITQPYIVDDVPPQTSVHFTGASLVFGTATFIHPNTLISFSSTDTAEGGIPGTGVQSIRYRIDNDIYLLTYVSPFVLPAGFHTINYYSTDNLGNIESLQTAYLFVDESAPQTGITFSPTPFFNGIQTFITTTTLMSLQTTDLPSGSAVQMGRIETNINNQGFNTLVSSTYSVVLIGTATISAQGPVLIAVRGVDLLENMETPHVFDLVVSSNIPSVVLTFLGAHAVDGIGNHVGNANTMAVLISSNTNLSDILYSLDGSSFTSYQNPIAFGPGNISTPGLHQLTFVGVRSDLSWEEQTSFDITIDTIAPSFLLTLQGGQSESFDGAPFTYVNTNTSFLFSAENFLEAAYQLKGANLTTIQGPAVENLPLSLVLSSTIPKTLTVSVSDEVLNISSSSSRYQWDNTLPDTSLSVSASGFLKNNQFYYSGSTWFTLTATDTLSGTDFVSYKIDQSSYSIYTSSFQIPVSGSHSLSFFSNDRVGNVESTTTLSFVIDNEPPAVFLQISGSSVVVNNQLYVSLSNTYLPSATDSGVGLQSIYTQIDQNTPQLFNSLPFVLNSTGPHTIGVWASDLLNNQSNTLTAPLFVDGDAPVSALLYQGPFDAAGPDVVISSQTSIVVTATDTGSGVLKIEYSIDENNFGLFGSSFSLSGGGHHQIQTAATDKVGVRESTQTFSIFVDTTPPAMPLGFSYLITGSTLTFFWSQNSEADLNGYYLFENGILIGTLSAAEYTTSIPLPPNGQKIYGLTAFDRVDNNSTAAVLNLSFGANDNLPPRTTLLVSTPQYTGGNPLTVFISSLTILALQAVDDAVMVGDGQGLGVLQSWIAVDTAPFTIYGGSFTLTQHGPHTLQWWSEDIVNNIEASTGTVVYVDTIAPAGFLSIKSDHDALFFKPGWQLRKALFVSTTTPISIIAKDIGSGVALIEYRVDPASSTPFLLYNSTFSIPREGKHTVQVRIQDHVGNKLQFNTLVYVDGTPPVSQLTIGSPKTSLPSGFWLISSTTPLVFTATDPVKNGVASGVKSIYVSIGTAPFTVTAGTITIATSGLQTIRYYSEDKVSNAEIIHSTMVVMDASTPHVKLLAPAEGGEGLDRVYNTGVISVYATVTDSHLFGFLLEAAAGENAQNGFTPLTGGTTPVTEQMIFTTPTGLLTGPFTLKLSAMDLLGRTAASTANVYLGNPSLALIIQNDIGPCPVIDDPQGVATNTQQRIFVSNTGRNNILKLDSTGALMDIWDGATPTASTQVVTFNKPIGLDVKASKIYVSDSRNHRVAILDSGGNVIQSIGKTDALGFFLAGSGPGELRFPSGVAVASDALVVADTFNNRLQIFDSNGIYSSEIDLNSLAPPAPAMPFGVDWIKNKMIAASDENNDWVQLFYSSGSLFSVVGSSGSQPGSFIKPQDVAVSSHGYLYVGDRTNSRVQKLDPFQNVVLSFGDALTLGDPVGVAIDELGRVFVTDANGDRIVRYEINVPTPTLVNIPALCPPLSAGDGNGGTGSNDPANGESAFTWGSVYVFPNPVQGGGKITFHIETGEPAESIKIKIFTMSGSEIHEESLGTTPSLIDSNDGRGPQWAHEHTWETAPISAGVYVYSIEAEKSGKRLKKNGYLAVVK